MAAGGSEEPNLTPFIDLFSVLVCFLLMTAAWLQLETLQTNIESALSKEAPPEGEPPPPPEKEKVKLAVSLMLQETIMGEGETETKFPRQGKAIDVVAVRKTLEAWRSKYPAEQKDVVVNSEAGVVYGDLISVYDLLIETGWPDVGINPN